MTEENFQEGGKKEYTLRVLLSKAWELFSQNFKLILTAALVIAVPLRLISTYFVFRQVDKIGTDFITNPSEAFSNFGSMSGQALLIGIFFAVGTALTSLMIAWIVKTKVTGGQLDFSAVWQKALSRLPQAIITTIIMGVLLAVLFILLVVPGVIFLVFWAFAIYAVVLNNKSGMDALNYSKSIVAGKWGIVFLYLLVIGILMAIIAGIINGIIGTGGDSYLIVFLQGVVGDVVNAFFIISSVLLFLNLESLKLGRIADSKS